MQQTINLLLKTAKIMHTSNATSAFQNIGNRNYEPDFMLFCMLNP